MSLEEAKRAALEVERCANTQWEVRRRTGRQLRGGVLPPSFPVIYDVVSGDVLEPAIMFMYSEYVEPTVGRDKKNTLDALAADLIYWWQYLDEVEVSWIDALPAHLNGYCQALKATISLKTGKQLNAETIKRRRSTIKSLYSWASKQMKISDAVTIIGSLAAPGVAENLKYKHDQSQHKPSPLTAAHAKELLPSVGKMPSELIETADLTDENQATFDSEVENCGIRLGCQIALEVGLRVEEVANLPAAAFEEYYGLHSLEPVGKYDVTVRGKGGKNRKCEFSGSIVREIILYITHLRPKCIGSLLEHSPCLLLHSAAAGRRWTGRSLSTRALQRGFTSAAKGLDFVRKERFELIRDGKVVETEIKSYSKYTFHDLRHTYAVWTYYFLRRTSTAEPWAMLQAQLGHAHKSTTINTYLTVTKEFEAQMSDAYLRYLNS